MAMILSRMETITKQIHTYEEMYSSSHNAKEKAKLSREMSRLTTEYLELSERLG